MVANSHSLDLATLSPETRQELELWGQSIAGTEAEVFTVEIVEHSPVVVEILRANAIRAYLLAEADRHLKELVFQARANRVSWRKIGQALGITGEAARLRYGTAD